MTSPNLDTSKLRELAASLLDLSEQPQDVAGAQGEIRDAAIALPALLARIEGLERAVKEAVHVSTATIDYFLARGDKQVAAEHIKHRSRIQAALSEQQQ